MSTCSKRIVSIYYARKKLILITIKINVLRFCITEKVEEEQGYHDRKLEGESDERNVEVVEMELISNNDGPKRGTVLIFE